MTPIYFNVDGIWGKHFVLNMFCTVLDFVTTPVCLFVFVFKVTVKETHK